MKVGRNDPCPCGSGKKYKKCCMKQKMQKKGWRSRGEFWDRFEFASYADKISLFQDYIRSSNPDEEDIFDMLCIILDECRERRFYDTFPELVSHVKKRLPEIYEEQAPIYSIFLVENMALNRDFSNLPSVLEPYEKNPDNGIDEFFRVIELLMYFNQTDVLIPTMEKAYSNIQVSDKIIPSGKDEFSMLLGWFIIFKSLKEQNMEGLYPLVSKYWDISEEDFGEMIEVLIGGSAGTWKGEDFLKGKPRERIENRMLRLTTELVQELNKKGIGYSKALLARNTLLEYLFETEHFEDAKKGSFLLIPTRKAFDRHLATYLNPLNNLPFRVISLIEAFPLYLEFLYTKGLIESGEFERCLKSMCPLKEDVLRCFREKEAWGEAVYSIEDRWRSVKIRMSKEVNVCDSGNN